MSIVAKRSPISATAELLLIAVTNTTLHYTYEITTKALELSAHCEDVFYNHERSVLSLTDIIYKAQMYRFTLLYSYNANHT